MYSQAKYLFYYRLYYVIRLGERLYAYRPGLDRLPLLQALGTLLYHFFRLWRQPGLRLPQSGYSHFVFLETLNQKNAVIDVFELLPESQRQSLLFAVSSKVSVTGYSHLLYSERYQFAWGLWYLPKAFALTRGYARSQRGVLNRTHVYVNMALFLAAHRQFMQLLRASGVSRVVLTNDHNLQALALMLAARDLQLPTYYIQHAAVSEAFPMHLSHTALLEGQQALDVYQQLGILSRRIHLVGIPRLDGLLGIKTYTPGAPLTVGLCLKPYYSMELIVALLAAIRKASTVVEVVLRPHPGNTQAFYDTLAGLGVRISNARLERPQVFIQSVDVLLSGESSIILEAALLGVKTLYFDDGVAAYDLYGFVRNGITEAVTLPEIPQRLEAKNITETQSYFEACRYYCSTIGTPYANRSKELIINHIFDT